MVNNAQPEYTGFFSELKRNGWSSIKNRHSDSSSFRLVWDLELANISPVRYTLSANVSKRKEDSYIMEESLDSTEFRQGHTTPYNYFR